MNWTREFRFVFAEHDHWKLALVAAAVFFGGLASAIVVVRAHLYGLMRFPLWLMSVLMRFLSAFPNYYAVFFLIFIFNSVAMCVYMLTGVLPVLPHIVCFMTGMNIGIVVLTGGVIGRQGLIVESADGVPMTLERGGVARARDRSGSSGGCFGVVCFLIVVMLELPALWFAIAMGTSIGQWWHDADPGVILGATVVKRLRAYGAVIVPILAVSGALESIGVLTGLKEMASMRSGPPCSDSAETIIGDSAGDDDADPN